MYKEYIFFNRNIQYYITNPDRITTQILIYLISFNKHNTRTPVKTYSFLVPREYLPKAIKIRKILISRDFVKLPIPSIF